jgi:hypothetical protein
MAQHHIAGKFHVSVVLRQFFVTLKDKTSLGPGPMRFAHGGREGTGLITADAFEAVWQVLLDVAYCLADLGDRPTGPKFGVTVPVHLTSSQGRTNEIPRQSNTVSQNDEGRVRIGHIMRAEVNPLIAQCFDNLHHPIQGTIDIGEKLFRGYGHGIPPSVIRDVTVVRTASPQMLRHCRGVFSRASWEHRPQ